jgi:cytochrome P450
MSRTTAVGSKELSGLKALRAWRRDPIGVLERVASGGDVVRLRLPRLDAWLLNHPDLIRDVLVSGHHRFMKGPTIQASKRLLGESLLTSEGDVHRAHRRLIQPIFHHERIEAYGPVMVEQAERTADRWRDGEVVDVHGEMTRLTLSVVGRALFDADVEAGEAGQIGRALSDAMANFGRMFSPLFPLLARLPVPAMRRFNRDRRVLDATIYRMIAERRARGMGGGDLLSLLLRARDDEVAGMTDEQVRDEAMTLFLAGHETTAVALTWTLYLLSQHSDAEARLHSELDGVLGDSPPTTADISRLPYTQMVLRESMRLFPPAWAIGRRALSDHRVDGHTIRARSVIVVSPYLVHRDPRWWPEPLSFRPERWAEADQPPRLAYFPFGAGPRMCIGEPFAWMEAVLVVATIARRWRLRLVPGHPIEFQPAVTLRPKHGVRMTLERRER